MQYVKVAINKKLPKLQQTFTYLIPPQLLPKIKIGLMVLVPFRNWQTEAVIVEIKKTVSSQYKAKLKSITKIISPYPIIDNARLELAKWLSDYYLAPLGEIIFMMTPSVPRRLTKELLVTPQALTHKLSSQINVYTLYDRYNNRTAHYLKLIKKIVTKSKQVILLLPEISTSNDLIKKINQLYGEKTSVLSSILKASQRYQLWQDIYTGKKQIIIGSRSAIFAPCQNLGLIIIDSPENFAYKEEQSPHYHSLTVAKRLSQIYHSPLVLGSLAPTVESYYHERQKQYIRIKNHQLQHYDVQIELVNSLIDRDLITWKLQREIAETLKQNKKVIIFVNQKGQASGLVCQDCGYTFKCPDCTSCLTLHCKPNLHLICHHCGKQTDIATNCPNCQGSRLEEIAAGVEKVSASLKKLFPDAKIITQEESSQAADFSKFNIIIGTQKILNNKLLSADLVGIVCLDFILNRPDIKSLENIFITVMELVEKTKNKLVIQTKNPKSWFWQVIISQNFNEFYKEEINSLEKLSYPPFSQLIRLVYENKNLPKAEKESAKLAKIISSFNFSGPVPCYLSKKREKYRFQIVIKIKNNAEKKRLQNILENFAKNWKVDTDPISLL